MLSPTRDRPGSDGWRRPTEMPDRFAHAGACRRGNVAFLCLFAAQAGVLTLSPILPAVAREFGISTAAAGQLRTLAGLSGAIAAIAVVLVGARVGLRRLLLAGNGLLALGSAASAAAPTLIALAVAQVMIGAAGGLLISGGLAAAATWAPAGRQAKALAWASLGQPASWVAAMPLTGMTADLGWRYAWLGVPLAAGLAGLAAVHSRPVDQGAVTPVQRANSLRWDAKLVGWTLGELLSYAGWGGALVYAGALLVESYDAAPGTVGLLLGAAAIAAFPGNFQVRRWLSGSARELLKVLGLSAAAITAVFGTARPGLLLSTGTFTLLVLVATTRTVAGSRPAAQRGGGALGLMRAARLAAQGQTGPRKGGTRAPQTCGDRSQKDRSDLRGIARAESAAAAIGSKNSMPAIHQRLRDGVAKDLAKPVQARGWVTLPALQSRPTDEMP